MAMYHFHADQIKRSAGRTAVAAAAYRAGEKLYNEWDGLTHDYTAKGGVIHTEIMLPVHAPPEYANRAILWNAVEQVEKRRDAQLCYSFDIALQNELTMDENIALAQEFVRRYFVSEGMICDLAVHNPDKDGSIENPHFHVLAPIRSLDENGKWQNKQRREYHLDENGERIRKPDGTLSFDAVPLTDWGTPEKLEYWREKWAELVNEKFAEKGLSHRIDHRSYEDQGLDVIPTIHEGPNVRQMEAKGIQTDKGARNRWIRATNAALRMVRDRLSDLATWIVSFTKELAKKNETPADISLVSLLSSRLTERKIERMSWSRGAQQKGALSDLKKFSQMTSDLKRMEIYTVGDLQSYINAQQSKFNKIRKDLRATQKEQKEIRKDLEHMDTVDEYQHLYDKYSKIFFENRKKKFKEEHKAEFQKYNKAYHAVRKKYPSFDQARRALNARLGDLDKEEEKQAAKMQTVRDETKAMIDIKRFLGDMLPKDGAEAEKKQPDEPKRESVLKVLNEPVPEKPKPERSSDDRRIKPESERHSLRASLKKHQQEVDEREANRTTQPKKKRSHDMEL